MYARMVQCRLVYSKVLSAPSRRFLCVRGRLAAFEQRQAYTACPRVCNHQNYSVTLDKVSTIELFARIAV